MLKNKKSVIYKSFILLLLLYNIFLFKYKIFNIKKNVGIT